MVDAESSYTTSSYDKYQWYTNFIYSWLIYHTCSIYYLLFIWVTFIWARNPNKLSIYSFDIICPLWPAQHPPEQGSDGATALPGNFPQCSCRWPGGWQGTRRLGFPTQPACSSSVCSGLSWEVDAPRSASCLRSKKASTDVAKAVDIFYQILVVFAQVDGCLIWQCFILVHLHFGLYQRVDAFPLLLFILEKRPWVLFRLIILEFVLFSH